MGLHRRHLKGRRARAARWALALMIPMLVSRGQATAKSPPECRDANLARERTPKCAQALVTTQALERVHGKRD